jgi:trk system potassium uptake protein TrkH
MLIILGGLGYIVWWDVLRVLRDGIWKKRSLRRLTLHSKIVLSVTAMLLVFGTVAIFLFEYNNPLTIGNMSLLCKIQAAFFQSVTTRTAGFAAIPQEALTTPSVITSLFLMFIGGSPVGTAGGIKTVTFAVIVLSAMSAIKNENRVALFGRTIIPSAVSKALAVLVTAFSIMFISTMALSIVTDAPLIDILYETISATATVGLTRGITPTLDTAGKIIISITMYLGRVGPISLVTAFTLKNKTMNIIKEPTEEISVG